MVNLIGIERGVNIRCIVEFAEVSAEEQQWANSMSFSTAGYEVTQRFLEPGPTEIFRQAALAAEANNTTRPDLGVPNAPAFYKHPAMEGLLHRKRVEVERISGRSLFETYSYFRIYRRGDALRKHKDRPACEISVTLNLGSRCDTVWPIWVHANGHDIPVPLKTGDAMIYKGCEVAHWRESYMGQEQVQVFLHYVDRQGPHSNHRQDCVEGALGSGEPIMDIGTARED